jgi:phosphate starvation-inducible PhoH-like protein
MKNIFVPAKPHHGQKEYYKSIQENEITICTGYAGTGKTFLALSAGLRELYDNRSLIKRIVIIRPYMHSNIGEDLGALPGDLREKVLPYVEGIKDNMRELIHNEGEINRLIKEQIEFTILSMCRGRSFNNCFVIVEEAQNVPLDGGAMKMILTRIGKNTRMVIAGDLDQCDIPLKNSALVNAINLIEGLDGVGIVSMEDYEIVHRNPLVKKILQRYSEHNIEY